MSKAKPEYTNVGCIVLLQGIVFARCETTAQAIVVCAACNCHDELVAACESALSYLPAKDGLRTGDPDGDAQLIIANKLRAILAKVDKAGTP